MELVKYFAGSRAMGNMSWDSDLDFVRVYSQKLNDIFAGVPVHTWDEYPKDLADMYEITNFMEEILWRGNSYLHSVMMANKKENTTEIWEKYEQQILEISITGLINNPYNRWDWIDRNLQLITQGDEVVKRVAWIYYWLLQAQVFCEDNTFIIDIDTILEYNDKTNAGLFWNLKREGVDVYPVSIAVVMQEIGDLMKTGHEMEHPFYHAIYEDNIEGRNEMIKKHMLGRKIILDMRSQGIKEWNPPDTWECGYR